VRRILRGLNLIHGNITREIASIFLISMLIATSSTSAFAEVSIGVRQNLSGLGGSLPRISAVGDNVYVTWFEGCTGGTCLLFRASHDNGATFDEPITLDIGVTPDFHYQIVAIGNDVHMIWAPNFNQVRYTASHDSGVTFDEPITLGVGVEAALAAVGENVYAAWSVFRTDLGRYEIKFRASHNSGTIFEDEVKLNQERASPFLRVFATGDDVSVLWRGYSSESEIFQDLFLITSHDNGNTFGDPLDITALSSTDLQGESMDPSIAFSGAELYIAWTQGFDESDIEDVYFVSSNNSGDTFTEPVKLSQNNNSRNIHVDTSDDGNLVFISWFNAKEGEAIFGVSNDHGASFELVTLTLGSPTQLVSRGDNVFVLMIEDTETLFTVSNDNGATFEPVTNINDDFVGGSFLAQMAVSDDSNIVYFVYQSVGGIFFRAGFVTTVTPTVEELMEHINNMDLPHEIQTSLISPLKQAQKLLDDDNPSNDPAACGKLDAFINIVNSKEKNYQLTSDQALVLRQSGNDIEASLFC
jgi:hypothetical protein